MKRHATKCDHEGCTSPAKHVVFAHDIEREFPLDPDLIRSKKWNDDEKRHLPLGQFCTLHAREVIEKFFDPEYIAVCPACHAMMGVN